MTALALAALLALPAISAELTPKEKVLWGRLEEKVRQAEGSLDGVLGVVIKDLKTGTTFGLRPDEPFPQASSIKLTVLYEAYRQAEEGKLDLDEPTTPPFGNRVRGGGVLQELGPRVRLTWRDLAVMMMGWSDNEASNLLIDRVGLDSVNARLDSLGLRATRLRRRMMDLEAARAGRENVSTPGEMVRLIEILRDGVGLSPARARDLLEVAMVTKDSPFRQLLPEELRIADKPGSLEGVRCVTAFVDLKNRPYLASLMTAYLKRDADGETAIRNLSLTLFETFDRLSRSSELGRIISER